MTPRKVPLLKANGDLKLKKKKLLQMTVHSTVPQSQPHRTNYKVYRNFWVENLLRT